MTPDSATRRDRDHDDGGAPRRRNSRTVRRLVQRRCGVGARRRGIAGTSVAHGRRPPSGPASMSDRSVSRRACREDRDDAWVAAPHAAQNAMSGTTWSQCGHSSGSSDWISSWASCSSARCRPTRSSEQRDRGHREMDGQLQQLGNAGDVDEAECGVDGEDRRGEARQSDADVVAVLVNLVGRAGEPQRGADQPADARRRSAAPRCRGCPPRR